MTTSGYLSIPQLARRIGCGHSTLYADIKAGRFAFPLIRIGADLRVPLAAVEAFESGRTTDESRLVAHVAALEAEIAALREGYRRLGAALANIFDTPATGPTASLGPYSVIGEKCRSGDAKGLRDVRKLG